MDKLVLRLDNIQSHYYITKSQSAYLNSIKDNLNNETAVILLDYAENLHTYIVHLLYLIIYTFTNHLHNM